MRQLKSKLQFLTIGGIAFIVDASVYLLLTERLLWTSLMARIFAFSVAVGVTCAGNRLFTFATRQHKQFYRQYCLALMAGMISLLPNMMLFMALLHLLPSSLVFTLAAFASGTIVGVVSNYILSDRFVFSVKV